MASLYISGLDTNQVWDTERAFQHFHSLGKADTKRTAERHLHLLGILPAALEAVNLEDELGRLANQSVLAWALATARRKRKLVLFAQLHALKDQSLSLHANDARGARYWVPLRTPENASPGAAPDTTIIVTALKRLQEHVGKEIAVFPHGELVRLLRDTESLPHVSLSPNAYPPILQLCTSGVVAHGSLPPYLKRLEAESIHLLREAIADACKPVMLYSGGKDSTVMLHLARKAFYPTPPPCALMIDTGWQFKEMALLRDHMAQQSGMNLLLHANSDATGQADSLSQALESHKFDVVLSADRYEDETWSATERMFSVRSKANQRGVNTQQARLWHFTNIPKKPDEALLVSPLLNWSELDIWHYIYQSAIPVSSLYFAKKRPVVSRDGALILIDDNAFGHLASDEIFEKQVRIRTLGSYPPICAVESTASTVAEIIVELINTRNAEKQIRAINRDTATKAEKKNRRGVAHGSK